METKEVSADLKSELRRSLEQLTRLRDEARLHLHLASLDAKQEWEKLDPKILALQSAALELGESSKDVVVDLVKSVEDFVDRLVRGRPS
jgi:hypothetical protein